MKCKQAVYPSDLVNAMYLGEVGGRHFFRGVCRECELLAWTRGVCSRCRRRFPKEALVEASVEMEEGDGYRFKGLCQACASVG